METGIVWASSVFKMTFRREEGLVPALRDECWGVERRLLINSQLTSPARCGQFDGIMHRSFLP